jgi:hypothetical protein
VFTTFATVSNGISSGEPDGAASRQMIPFCTT